MKWLCVLAITAPLAASAAVSRGGFGLLFPDANSLANVGSTARGNGFSAELLWAKFSGSHQQTLSPSASWANGRVAVATYASRYGMSLFDSTYSEAAFGAGLGVAVGDGFTLGFSIDRSVDPHQSIARGPTDAILNGTLGWQGTSGFGFALSAGGRFGAAVGWQGAGWRVEAVGDEDGVGGFGAYQGGRWYTSFGAKYLGGAVRAPQALLRLGYIFGTFDLSAFASYVFKERENPFHGGALRLVL